MKNMIKLFGIIALVAVIGFSITACSDGGGGVTYVPVVSAGNVIPPALIGKWYTYSGNNPVFEIRDIGVFITSYDSSYEKTYDISVSGNTVILKNGNATVGIFDYEISFDGSTMTTSNGAGTLGKTIDNNSPFEKIIIPAAPSNVTASATSSNRININWSSVSRAIGYYVYRSSSVFGFYDYIGSTYSTSYTDTELSANTTYYYKVSAYNIIGEGFQSLPAYATTLQSNLGTIPAAPSNVTASALSSGSIIINWSSVSGASGYYVYRSSSVYGSYDYIGSTYSTYSTSYTDTGLSSNATYYYRVSAYNSAGESSLSSYTYATTSFSSPSGTIDLTLDNFYSTTLSAGATHTYRFYANSGTTYYIRWEDSDNSTYGADITVGLKREGSTTYVVNVTDSNPITFYPSTSGYYIIEVQEYSYSSSPGTYRIKYSNY